ncbi:hypothetical protein VYU27_008450 [Nannochloropsis oceanica]
MRRLYHELLSRPPSIPPSFFGTASGVFAAGPSGVSAAASAAAALPLPAAAAAAAAAADAAEAEEGTLGESAALKILLTESWTRELKREVAVGKVAGLTTPKILLTESATKELRREGGRQEWMEVAVELKVRIKMIEGKDDRALNMTTEGMEEGGREEGLELEVLTTCNPWDP